MVFDKTDCNCKDNNVNWYVRQDDEQEDRIRVPDEVIFNDKKENKHKPLIHECKHECKSNKPSTDTLLKEFIFHCEELENNIVLLNKYRDSYRTNSEYSKFRKEVTDIKNKAIVEAYNRKIFDWKKDI